MSCWVIDFEASGLSKASYPIEVGITNGSKEYSALIKPMSHWISWDASAETVHRISKNKLLSDGLQSLIVARRLNELLHSEAVYCDNIHWDGFWLNVLFSDNCLTPTFDILDIQELIKTEKQLNNFEYKKRNLESSGVYKKHRAIDDAIVIQRSLCYSMGS